MAIGKKGERGHYVTLQTHGADGKPGPRHVVFIRDGAHHVEHGHPSLKGKRAKPSHPLPAHWHKAAREAKLNPDHVHALAAELRGHHHSYTDSVNHMLRRAREIAKNNPHRFGSLSNLAHAFRGGDLTQIKGFDLLATQMRDEYPELFAGHHEGQDESHHGVRENAGATSADERLYELLQHGNHRPMTHEEAHEQAFRHLDRHRPSAKRDRPSYSDDVPFSSPADSSPLGAFGGASVGLSPAERAEQEAAGNELARLAGLSSFLEPLRA